MQRLLDDLTALREYVGSPGGPPYEELVKENDRLAAEREEYRAALERIASAWAQPARDIARQALKL